MRCLKCNKQAQTGLRHLGRLCKICFCQTIEKRIRKYVRINKVFSKNDRIIAVGPLNQYLIQRIIEGLPAKIISAKRPGKGKNIILKTADDIACELLQGMLQNRKTKNQHTSIVRVCTDEELMLFCKYRKISFKPNNKDPDVMKILNTLQKKHPETKFSVAKSEEKMQRLLRSKF
ncbi:MAG: hypothetical protein ABIF10_03005 [Candidatus Woesearchaeota archaeon]